MITLLLVTQVILKSGKSLVDLMSKRSNSFPNGGKINFKVNGVRASIYPVLEAYRAKDKSIDELDGESVSFED